MHFKDPRPAGDRLLIQVVKIENVTDRGIAIPDSKVANYQAKVGVVIEQGTSPFPVDSLVIFNRGAGLDISYLFDTPVTVLVLNTNDVIATLSKTDIVTVGHTL